MDDIDIELGLFDKKGPLEKVVFGAEVPLEKVVYGAEVPLEQVVFSPTLDICESPSSTRDMNLLKLRYKILVRLVVNLQSIWRGRKLRRVFLPEIENIKAQREKRRIFLSILEVQEDEITPHASPPHMSGPIYDDTPTHEEKRMDEKTPTISPHGSEPAMAMNLIKSACTRYLDRLSLARERIFKLAQTNVVVDKDDESSVSDFDVESVDIYVGKDVVGTQGETSWAVEEVTDTERYELQFERLRHAAVKIQRFVRRYLTRKKFMQYINNQTTSAVLEEQIQQAQDAEERGEPAPDSEAVAAQGTISTEGCVMM